MFGGKEFLTVASIPDLTCNLPGHGVSNDQAH